MKVFETSTDAENNNTLPSNSDKDNDQCTHLYRVYT